MEGTEDWYRALFAGCHRALLAYALRRSSSVGRAEDVVAETFLVAWRRAEDVPQGDEALAWLIGVARLVLANANRGDARRDRLLVRLRHHRWGLADGDDPEVALVARDETAEVRAAMQRLRPMDAEVLKLAFWDHLSQAQIARVLDCSVNAVSLRLYRARGALRAELEKASAGSGHNSVVEPLDGREIDD